ncbi:CUN040 hypothetical protein [Culex nigripalpus nucleopolyhedrovirus]|uniref:Uncharacterized protein n=1 Tax=Culex nigripalpus nucleopolyhedrovirus (isolate Florida/1997) TaxID=645993 RepID=Q919M9_NPVCO|nr:CUN040 hypothetical protein [Culex nigripalpus nucleopolyhedrovirus]AAK94118.1 CUN040 hypothetical protein [Culex nigripalpus nucleopolyhedrovirus]
MLQVSLVGPHFTLVLASGDLRCQFLLPPWAALDNSLMLVVQWDQRNSTLNWAGEIFYGGIAARPVTPHMLKWCYHLAVHPEPNFTVEEKQPGCDLRYPL